jgi:tetratricopeptide (TPR) repeat protein
MFRFAGAFLASGLLALVLLALYGPASKQKQAPALASKPATTSTATQVAAGTPIANIPRTTGAIDLFSWARVALQGVNSRSTTTPTPRATATISPRLEAEQHYKLGYAFYVQDNNFEEAIKELDIALKLNPNHLNATYLRGNAYSVTRQPEKALADFNKTLLLNPDYAEAYASRGFVYRFYMGDYDRAIADDKKSISLAPTYGAAYSELGLAYYDMGDYDQAIIAFDKAIQVSPFYSVAYYNRGVTYSDMDESEKAIKDFTRTIELNPRYWRAYDSRAWEYEYMENTAAAIADFKMVIDLSNDPDAVQRAREQILALQGT